MSIDFKSEEILALADASRALPLVAGKRPHLSTIWRWIYKGCGGVRLEHARIGHRVVTSREALERFLERLNAADMPSAEQELRSAAGGVTKPRTGKQRARDIADAKAELAAAGI